MAAKASTLNRSQFRELLVEHEVGALQISSPLPEVPTLLYRLSLDTELEPYLQEALSRHISREDAERLIREYRQASERRKTV